MPQNRNTLRALVIGAASVVALAVAGVIGLTSHDSRAQTSQQAPAAQQPAATNKPIVANRVTAASPATVAANKPALTNANATQTGTKPVAASTATNGVSNSGSLAAGTALKPNTPVLLRRPMAPARVQWSSAMSQLARMKSARKPNNLASRLPRATLDRTRLPVILPREGLIDTAKAKMFSFGDAYALNMPQAKGTQITMYGNRSFVAADKGAISARPVQKLAGMAEDIRISQMEDGWTATFTRYGVVYSLDVSCDDTASPDCQTDSYIRNAITQFDDVTMGSEAQSEANQQMQAEKPSGNILDQVSKTISKITKGG